MNKKILIIGMIAMFLFTIPASAFDIPFFGDGKVEKTFNPSTKAISLLNDKSEAGIEITTISVTQDIDKFEEVFKVTAKGESYNPSELTDFLLRYEDKSKKDISSKITSERWYYQETVPYTISVPEYGLIEKSEIITTGENTTTYWNETGVIGYHNEIRYKDVWTELNKDLKKIKKDESIVFKLVLTKRVVLGEDAILIVPTFMDTEVEEMTWWNSSWLRKSPILINNTGNDTGLGYYQVYLNVTYDSDMNVDFSDLRVVNDTSRATVPHWNESAVQGSYTNIWFNASYIPASSWTNDTYYLYYNESPASSVSNIGDVFTDCYTPENGKLPNESSGEFPQWTKNGVEDAEIVDSVLHLVDDGGAGSWIHYSRDWSEESTDGYVIEFEMKCADPSDIVETGVAFGTGENNQDFLWFDTNLMIVYSSNLQDASLNYADQTYRKFKIVLKDTNVKVYVDSVKKIDGVWSTSYDDDHINFGEGVGTGTANGESWWKYIFVRKYSSPEPTAQLGAEEYPLITVYGTTEYNTQRKLVRTSEGYLHRVYVSNNRTYYSRSTDNGNNWVETVLTDAGVNNTHPSIAGDSEDNIWVFYEREGSGIRYRVWRGTSWQSEQTLTTDSGEVPVVAVDSSDDIHVGYMVNHSTYQINYTYYDGTSWSTTSEISTDLEDQKYPTIAIDSNDYIHVAYQGYNSTSLSYNIKYRKYTTSWQSIYNITSGELFSQTFPCIAVDLSDYIHVVWMTDNLKVNYRKYTTSWQSVEEICDGGDYWQVNPSISVYSTNYVYVTWFGKTDTYSDNYIIREKHYSGSWSAITDIIHPAGKDVAYPGSISALHPIFCTNCYPNIPLTGFSIVYDEDDGTIEYYNASTWRCPDKYVITIIAKDISTNQVINNFTVLLSTGETGTTDNGIVKFRCLDTGYYEVTVSSNLYHSTQQSIVLDASKEVILYLVEIVEADYYGKPLFQVEFRVVDIYGRPVSDVTVTAVGVETTMEQSWFRDIFGYRNETELQNTTMTGTTDDYGSVIFFMLETVKYKITFVKASEGVNETLYIYPKDSSYYTVVVRLSTQIFSPGLREVVDWEWSEEEINPTHYFLNLSYNDTSAHTKSLNFFVFNESGLLLYNTTVTNTSVHNFSYTLSPWKGVSVYATFTASYNDSYFENIIQTVYWDFPFTEKKVDFGLSDQYYLWISICLLLFVGSLFGAINPEIGGVVVSLFGGLLYYIGWLIIYEELIIIIIALAILVYINKKGRELQ